MSDILDLPKFYQPETVMRWDYRTNPAALARAAAAAASVGLSASDRRRVLLLLIDMQLDFCHPRGSLFVAGRGCVGALRDSCRIAEFIYRNARRVTDIIATTDAHTLFQCFFPEFWLLLGAAGAPSAHTLIGMDGNLLVNRALDGSIIASVVPDPNVLQYISQSDYTWLFRQMEYYVRRLEENGKPPLYLWPHHCLQGSSGQGIMPIVHEAMLYHGFLRRSPPRIVQKGMHPLTENYSVFRTEVTTTFDGMRLVHGEDDLLTSVAGYDAVIVAGEASSHCVAASLADVRKYFDFVSCRGRPDNFYILTDCMSPVVVPGADFTDQAAAELKLCEEAGMHLVKSTTSIDEWPDFPSV